QDALALLAGLLSELTYGDPPKAFRVTARPRANHLRRGDGFVTVETNGVGEFIGSYLAVFNAYLLLGSDESLADADLDDLLVPATAAVANWVGMDITVRPISIVGGESFQGETFAIAITCSVDVTS